MTSCSSANEHEMPIISDIMEHWCLPPFVRFLPPYLALSPGEILKSVSQYLSPIHGVTCLDTENLFVCIFTGGSRGTLHNPISLRELTGAGGGAGWGGWGGEGGDYPSRCFQWPRNMAGINDRAAAGVRYQGEDAGGKESWTRWRRGVAAGLTSLLSRQTMLLIQSNLLPCPGWERTRAPLPDPPSQVPAHPY